jgi:hypothetical protein
MFLAIWIISSVTCESSIIRLKAEKAPEVLLEKLDVLHELFRGFDYSKFEGAWEEVLARCQRPRTAARFRRDHRAMDVLQPVSWNHWITSCSSWFS